MPHVNSSHRLVEDILPIGTNFDGLLLLSKYSFLEGEGSNFSGGGLYHLGGDVSVLSRPNSLMILEVSVVRGVFALDCDVALA